MLLLLLLAVVVVVVEKLWKVVQVMLKYILEKSPQHNDVGFGERLITHILKFYLRWIPELLGV